MIGTATSLRKATSSPEGQLPDLTERDHWAVRRAFEFFLITLLLGFWIFTRQFWAPAHGGADQNGYLVGGKLMAEHLSAGVRPDDPYSFVGRMWIVTADGRYFPKYPLGLPLIVATVFKLAGPTAAYYISPVATTLALLGVFLLTRLMAGSFAGILGTLIVATSPVTLGLANNPNSHAATLCCATWGVYLLSRWWQRAGFWRASLAGLLLGFAATLRYSEALLGLPLLLVAVFNLRPRVRRSWLGAATLVGCWAAPILLLLLVNRVSVGSWTGYDATHESTGFDRAYLAQHWEVLLRQLAGPALFLTLPLGVVGLVQMFARNWKLATVLWAWLLPGVLLYGTYYWAPEHLGTAYARFFLTIFPPLALGAAWSLTALAPVAPHAAWAYRWIVGPLAALLIVLGAGAYNVWTSLPAFAADRHKAIVLVDAAEKVMTQAQAPPGSAIFGPREMLHHLQFVGDYRLYAPDEFDRRYLATLADVNPVEPTALQPRRAAALLDALGRKTDAELAGVLRSLTADHLDRGRRVFAIVPDGGQLPQRFADHAFDRSDSRSFDTRTVISWSEPEPDPRWGRRRGAVNDGYRALPGGEPLRWTLLEVTVSARKPSSTLPTTATTSRPSTPTP